MQRKSCTKLLSKLLLGGEFEPQCEEKFIEVGTIWMSVDSPYQVCWYLQRVGPITFKDLALKATDILAHGTLAL